MYRLSGLLVVSLLAGLGGFSSCRLGYQTGVAGENDGGDLENDARGVSDAALIDAALIDAALIDAALADAAEPDAMVDAMIDAQPDAMPPRVTVVTSGFSTSSAAVQNVAIAAVSLSESFVLCSRRSSTPNPDENLVRCRLTANNNLQINRGVADPNPSYVSWTIVEVPGAAVQSGTVSFSTNDTALSASLTAVDPVRTMVLVSSSGETGNTDVDEATQFRGTLVNAPITNRLRISRGDNSVTGTVDWQVIELPATVVKSGVSTLTDGNSYLSVPLNVGLDPLRSFVTFSTEFDNNIGGVETDYLAIARLVSGNRIDFSREGSTGDLIFSWFAVELPIGSSVRVFEERTVGLHDTKIFDTAMASIHANMFGITTAKLNSGSTTTDSLDSASLSTTISDSLLRVERDVVDGNRLTYHTSVIDLVVPDPNSAP